MNMYHEETENDIYSNLTRDALGSSYYDNIKETAVAVLDELHQQKDPEEPLVVADYGTADGVNFMSMMNSLLGDPTRNIEHPPESLSESLRYSISPPRKGAIKVGLQEGNQNELRGLRERDILIYLNDQPSNDFNLLMTGITGSGIHNNNSKNVSVAAIGRSMYQQCLPKNNLDVCFSTVAVHWLSRKPCDIKNGVTYFNADAAEKKAFQDQAREDWRNFVVKRGKELRKGGYCVVLCVSVLDEYDLALQESSISIVWRQLLNSGVITQNEFTNTTLAIYSCRQASDISYPFDYKDEEIVNLGLHLVSIKQIKHELAEVFRHNADKDPKHRKSYADMMVGYMVLWLKSTIYSGLSLERSESSRIEICNKFFSELWKMFFREEINLNSLPLLEVIIKKC